MSVAAKLFAILVFVALAPLGVFAWTAFGEHERALGSKLEELHRKSAEHGARMTELALTSAQHTIAGLAGAIPWGELSAEERSGAQLLVYRQLDDIAVVTLLDEHGNGLGASVSQAAEHHPHIAPVALGDFGKAIPFAAAHAGAAFGSPVRNAGDEPLVPIAVPVTGPGGAHWVLAVGYSLRGACQELAASAPPDMAARLDVAGERVCGSTSSDRDRLTTSAKLANGWTVTVEQPRAIAFASLHRVRTQTLVWLALGTIGALAAGLLLTQSIRRPLRTLTSAAEAVAAGKLDERVAVTSRDEFGALATSFNRMSSEISAWNKELQNRVDASTAELRDAQEQLLQSRKLAAIAALGAGVAHEINNPLAGVVGMTQLLLAKQDALDAKTVKSLTTIEREALRIRDIVERVSSLAQSSIGEAQRLDIVEVIDAATQQHAEQLASSAIRVERAFDPRIPKVVGNAAQLQHAIGQLVDNSLRAMPGGGSLKLSVRTIADDLVAIDVEDTGRGIDPEVIDRIFEPFFTTKDNWRGAGLGLAIVHRIVEAHHGRIRVASKLGSGTTMTVILPAGRRASHLDARIA